jgi:hypothetical protein
MLYRWDAASQSWTAQTSSSDALPRGKGFMLYLHDDAHEPLEPSGMPLSVASGSEDPSADKSAGGLLQDETFHLLGNPYGAAFALDSLAGGDLEGAGFQKIVQVWDPALGVYRQLEQSSPGGSGGASGDTLAAWQSAFVERSASGSGQTSLTFDAGGTVSGKGALIGSDAPEASSSSSSRQAAPPLASQQQQAQQEQQSATVALRLTVRAPDTTGVGRPPSPDGSTGSDDSTVVATDRAVLFNDDRAASGYDAYEARDLQPPAGGGYATATFPIERSGGAVTQRAQAARPFPDDLTEADPVPLAVQPVGAEGAATLSWPADRHGDVPSDWVVELRDTQTGETVNLRNEDYTFELESASGSSSSRSASSRSASSLEAADEARFRLTAQPAGTIPVELASFEATPAAQNDPAGGGDTAGGDGRPAMRLSWETATETNNDGFRVERRRSDGGGGGGPRTEGGGGGGWTAVATVASKAEGGASSEALRYTATDANVPFTADSLAYRLVQIDRDGTERSIAEQTVEVSGPEAFTLHGSFPNPMRSQTTIRYELPEEREVTVAVYDARGRKVRTLVASEEQKGRQDVTFAAEGLSSGVYFYRITAGDYTETRKLVLVR